MSARISVAAVMAGLVAACGGGEESGAPPDARDASAPPQAEAASEGRAAFRTYCGACHIAAPASEAGRALVAPNLFGVVGREAAATDFPNYSPALRDSGLVWDETALDAFIANPQQAVPRNRMYFPGVPNEQSRQAIIDYLRTLE